jgi:hypothetical protein
MYGHYIGGVFLDGKWAEFEDGNVFKCKPEYEAAVAKASAKS